MRRWRGLKWKPQEIELLRLYYGRKPVWWIAKHLQRSEWSVKEQIRRAGISIPQDDRSEWEPVLRANHATGAVDREIANELGCPVSTARARRILLNLPANGKSNPNTIARISEARYADSKVAMHANGVCRLSDYRSQQKAIAATKAGWGWQTQSEREADVLYALELQPMTCKELGQHLGVSRRRAAQLVQALRKRGKLEITGRRKSVPGRRSANVFVVAEGVSRQWCIRPSHKNSSRNGQAEYL